MTSRRPLSIHSPHGLRGRHADRRGSVPLLALPPSWVTRAACGATDPELFFPEPDDPHADTKTDHARKICAGCPVAAACDSYAATTRQGHGIWAGKARVTTPSRRRIGRHAADPEFDAIVLAMRADGTSIADIAARLGRSPRDIDRLIDRAQSRVRRAEAA